MATRIAIGTGDFTTAGTWGVVSTAANAMLDSELNSTTSTTSNVFSATFTPGAITITGVAVKVAARVASPSGTITVGLFVNTGSVLVAETTINVSDINNNGGTVTYNRGWYFFKWAAPVLLANVAHKVGIRSSVNAEVTLYRNNTGGNWSRMVLTNATGAPAIDDHLHVIGEHTGAGTGNSFVVTMENTATTSFGPTVSGGPADGITVGKRGTLAFATGASAYYLKWKGRLSVYDGGVFTVGTLASPINASGSAVLEMDSVANIDTGVNVEHGGTFTCYGATKTNFQTLMTVSRGGWCMTNGTAITNSNALGSQSFIGLTGTINIAGVNRTITSVTDAENLVISASAGVNATYVPWFHVGTAAALTVASTTGWANSDVLVFAPGTSVFSEGEKVVATTIDSGTTATLAAGLTAMHFGASPMQCEVGNLTRNVKVRGITSLLQGYISCAGVSTVTLYYSEFYQMGGAAQPGITVATTTGNFDMQYCSRYDSTVTSSRGVNITSASGNNITLSNNVFYNIQAEWLANVATTGVYTVNNNLFIRGNGTGMTVGDHGMTFTNNRICGSSSGVLISSDTGVLGTWSGNSFHGFTGSVSALRFGATFTGVGSTLSSTTIWGCLGNADGQIRFTAYIDGLTIDGLTCFYAETVQIGFNVGCNNILITNFTSNGSLIGSSGSAGIRVASTISTVNRISIFNSDFSTASGYKSVNLYDIEVNGAGGFAQITAHNTKFGGTTVAQGVSTASPGSFVAIQKFNQTAASHRTYHPYGLITYDATIFDATPSDRLTPNNATNRLQSGCYSAPVASGATCTPSIKVRESVVGDGTDYNGQRARLFVRKNVAAGIASDTLLATATVASEGAWETLSGTTAAVTDDCVLEFYVDCGGSGYTTGWVNVDTGSVLVSNASNQFKYWKNGGAFVDLASGQIGIGGGASSTYA